jgi:hypothetical protein
MWKVAMLWDLNFPLRKNNSRFRDNNSRLESGKLPISGARELSRKRLIWRVDFSSFDVDFDLNPEYFPSNRELASTFAAEALRLGRSTAVGKARGAHHIQSQYRRPTLIIAAD